MKAQELIRTVSNITGLSDVDVKDVLHTTAGVIAQGLGKNDKDIPLPGFGKIRPSVRWNARWRRCVLTHFRPSKQFQALVNGRA